MLDSTCILKVESAEFSDAFGMKYKGAKTKKTPHFGAKYLKVWKGKGCRRKSLGDEREDKNFGSGQKFKLLSDFQIKMSSDFLEKGFWRVEAWARGLNFGNVSTQKGEVAMRLDMLTWEVRLKGQKESSTWTEEHSTNKVWKDKE